MDRKRLGDILLKKSKGRTKEFASIALLLLTIACSYVVILPNALSTDTAVYEAVVIGTKMHWFQYEDNYIISSGTSLSYEAPSYSGWHFDYFDIDFGCEVGGVTGANVTEIFTIDNGCISFCGAG